MERRSAFVLLPAAGPLSASGELRTPPPLTGCQASSSRQERRAAAARTTFFKRQLSAHTHLAAPSALRWSPSACPPQPFPAGAVASSQFEGAKRSGGAEDSARPSLLGITHPDNMSPPPTLESHPDNHDLPAPPVEAVASFAALYGVVERLLGPGSRSPFPAPSRHGCPWDRSQTVSSLRPFILEEAYELIEAVDLGQADKVCEEIGDLIFNLLLMASLSPFQISDSLWIASEKLIRRHPHVFGEEEDSSHQAIRENWERIKAEEAGHGDRTSAIDGIPKDLPALARAQKAASRLERAGFEAGLLVPEGEPADAEERLGRELLELCLRARAEKLSAEQALLKVLAKQEAAFRALELEGRLPRGRPDGPG
eukprot:tig00000147_g9477.t1